MAHFAELDENNIVLRVVVVNNSDTTDANGNEIESIGQEFCHNLYGGRWIQTSYNHNFRNKYASTGMIYREDLDIFINPQPWPSWTFDEETKDWKCPVPEPTDDLMYQWDETTVSWEALTFEVTD